MAILPPRSASVYPCRREVLEHSFRLSVPLQRKIIDTSIDNERTAAGKWAGRFGYVRHDIISRKTKNRQIKIRQLESETNPPNLIPAKFSGYTVCCPLYLSHSTENTGMIAGLGKVRQSVYYSLQCKTKVFYIVVDNCVNAESPVECVPLIKIKQ